LNAIRTTAHQRIANQWEKFLFDDRDIERGRLARGISAGGVHARDELN